MKSLCGFNLFSFILAKLFFLTLQNHLIFFLPSPELSAFVLRLYAKSDFIYLLIFLFVHAWRAIKCRVRPVGCELKTRMTREWKQKSLVNLKNISTGTGRRSRFFHEAWKAITSGETFNATAAWIYEWSAMFSPAASARLEAAMFSNAKAPNHKFSRQVLDPNYHFCTIWLPISADSANAARPRLSELVNNF